jgi:hypothetical protein
VLFLPCQTGSKFYGKSEDVQSFQQSVVDRAFRSRKVPNKTEMDSDADINEAEDNAVVPIRRKVGCAVHATIATS